MDAVIAGILGCAVGVVVGAAVAVLMNRKAGGKDDEGPYDPAPGMRIYSAETTRRA